MFLPVYSPELQPAEHFWPLVHEAAANCRIEKLKELEGLLSERCRALAADTKLDSQGHPLPLVASRLCSVE